jgi:hypothetical protein
MPRAPILVMSFDRPGYLAQVLNSLKAQVGGHLDGRPIVLFQDGAVSAFNGKALADPAATRECCRLFVEAFPDGVVKESAHNLGVALNFDRAERHAFEELGADAAIFLEDDLVLGVHYLATLDALIAQFLADERVGYVAAYGDHRWSLKDQRANRRRLILLDHNWGFALFKRQWLAMRPRILEYLDTIAGRDYRERDEDRVTRLFESWGYGDPATSQDAAKTIACCLAGAVKLNTYVCHATYIGAHGLHMNEQMFAERGYARTEVYPEPTVEFDPLDEVRYQRLLAKQRYWANPTAEDFIAAVYRSVLRREPDPEGLAAYLLLFGEDPVTVSLERTILGLIESQEFTRIFEGNAATATTRLRLALQAALLGRIPPALRGVTCGLSQAVITIRHVFDGSIADRDRRIAAEIRTRVAAEFTACTVTSEVVRADFPSERQKHALAHWVYLRLE